MEGIKLNIVELIENNPITKLSSDYNVKFLIKIKEQFDNSKTNLDIEIAKSNLQGINIELSESEQTICGIEKTLAETQDQLNALRVFGLKNAKSSVTDIHRLEQDLIDQNSQLALERSHFSYLQQLQLLSQDTLKITLEKHAKIELFLKSKALLDIKSEQKKYETSFQSQQAIWLKRLNDLYATLAMLERNKQNSSQNYSAINIDIFYANENVNALYLQMLVMRYEEQIQQLKILAQQLFLTSVAVKVIYCLIFRSRIQA